MKYLLTFCWVILYAPIISAQEVELFNMPPQWEIGDVKHVTSSSSSQTYFDDSLFMNMDMSADYKIEVMDTTGHFTLKYSQVPDGLNMAIDGPLDTVQNFMMALIKELEEETKHFEYLVKVNKSDGLAFEMVNEEELISVMKKGMIKAKEKISGQQDINDDMIDKLMTMMAPEAIQTGLNGINYILQSYAISFPLNESYSENILTYDINAMGDFGDKEFPALMTVYGTEKDNGNLVVEMKTDYDIDFLFEAMKETGKMTKDLSKDDLQTEEVAVVEFNGQTTWIEKHTSKIVFTLGSVKVLNETKVVFK